uniref:MIP27042p n=1 Tax=Drosophila melanogaster TaxID=7227 RepID=E4NKJ1_DROME|nr:MIP27042p [Drosophila melanogaster]
MQPLNSSIDKAKHFFIESGILGPVNFKYSHDMIRKTSTIHIDETLKNQEALQAIMKALDSSDELMTKIKDSTPNLCLFCQPNSYKKFAEFQSF